MIATFVSEKEVKSTQQEVANLCGEIEEKTKTFINLHCQRKKNRFLEDIQTIAEQLEPIYQAKVKESGELIAKAWIGELNQKAEWENLNDLIQLFPVYQQFIISSKKDQNLFLDRVCFFSKKFLNKIVKLYPLARSKFLENLETTEEKKASDLIKNYQINKIYKNQEITELHWEALWHKLKNKKAGRKKDAPVMDSELFNEIKQSIINKSEDEIILSEQIQTEFASWGFKFKLADKNVPKKKAPSVSEKYKKIQEKLAEAELQIIEKDEIIRLQEIKFQEQLKSLEQYYEKKLENIHKEVEETLLSNGDFINNLKQKLNLSGSDRSIAVASKSPSTTPAPEENKPDREKTETTTSIDNQIAPEMRVKVIATGNHHNQIGTVTKYDKFAQKWWVLLDYDKNNGKNIKHQFLAEELTKIEAIVGQLPNANFSEI